MSSPFANLFALRRLGTKAGKPADDDEAKLRRKAKKRAADGDVVDDDDDVEDEDDPVDRKTGDGENEVADPDDDDDEEDPEDEADAAKRRAKKAKAKATSDDDDEDDDTAMKTKAIRVQARADERKRIGKILSHPAAVANPDAGLRIALRTSMPSADAIAMLESVGPASANRSAARARLAAVDVPDVGQGEARSLSTAKSLAADIITAGKKRRGEI